MSKPHYVPVARNARYCVIANHEFCTLTVRDMHTGILVNREDWIGAETHDALIAEARATHPELVNYRVARINHG